MKYFLTSQLDFCDVKERDQAGVINMTFSSQTLKKKTYWKILLDRNIFIISDIKH